MKRNLIAISAAAALAAAASAAPASASITLGALPADSSMVSSSCDDFLVWQASESGAGLTVPAGSWVITSLSVRDKAGAAGRSSKMKLLRPAPSRSSLDVVGEATIPMGTTDADVTVSGLGIRAQGGDILGLAGTPGNAGPCYYQGPFSDNLHAHGPGGDVPVGSHVAADYAGGDSPAGYRVDLKATLEPDADGDGFSDETSDTCPTDPTTHDQPCQADLATSGTVTPTTIGVGEVAVVTGTITNAGPARANDAALHVATGDGLQVVANLPQAGCAFTTELACPLGALNKGGSVPFAVAVKGTKVGTPTLTVSAASSTTDPNAANNAVSSPIKIEQQVPVVCTVPNLKGLTKGFAKKLLAAVHCKLGKATKKKAKKGKRGTVIKQSRKAKSVLPAGTKVNVTLKK
jgi:hypothetical protein